MLSTKVISFFKLPSFTAKLIFSFDSIFFLTAQNKMDVVCAVIKIADVINKGRNDLFLIAKHAKNKVHAGKWEFPRGKVEHEENHSDAVKREVMEELDA